MHNIIGAGRCATARRARRAARTIPGPPRWYTLAAEGQRFGARARHRDCLSWPATGGPATGGDCRTDFCTERTERAVCGGRRAAMRAVGRVRFKGACAPLS